MTVISRNLPTDTETGLEPVLARYGVNASGIYVLKDYGASNYSSPTIPDPEVPEEPEEPEIPTDPGTPGSSTDLFWQQKEIDFLRARYQQSPDYTMGPMVPKTHLKNDTASFITNRASVLLKVNVSVFTGGQQENATASTDWLAACLWQLVAPSTETVTAGGVTYTPDQVALLCKQELLKQVYEPTTQHKVDANGLNSRYVPMAYFDGDNYRRTGNSTSAYVENRSLGAITVDQNMFVHAAFVEKRWDGYEMLRAGKRVNFKDTTTMEKEIEDWFTNAGLYMIKAVDWDLSTRFRERLSNNYTYNGTNGYSSGSEYTHNGGYRIHYNTVAYNNRKGAIVSIAAKIGCYYNNARLKSFSERFFKEFIKYSVYPDGTLGEHHRNESGNPNKGWKYGMGCIQEMSATADAHARVGNYSLFDYKTKEGLFGTESTVDKSLLTAMINQSKYATGEFARYRFGSANESTQRINPVNNGTSDNNTYYMFYNDIANIYYQNAYIDRVSRHTEPGMLAWPSSTSLMEGGGTQPSWNMFFGVVAHGPFLFSQRLTTAGAAARPYTKAYTG